MTVSRLRGLAGFGLGLGMILGAAQASSAVTYSIATAGIDPSAGSENSTVHRDATSSHSALDEDAAIGRILLTGTTSAGDNFSFESFCVDIYDWLSSPATFTSSPIDSLNLTTTQTNRLTALLANVDDFIASGISGVDTGTTADRSAAAQLAVWEIVNETSTRYQVDGTMNSKGTFYVTNDSKNDNLTGKALSDAATILSDVKHGVWTADDDFAIALIGAVGNQTQIVYGPTATKVLGAVPEPATWGMMVLGFGAMGFALRRKRQGDPAII